jgi:hypothetical protein
MEVLARLLAELVNLITEAIELIKKLSPAVRATIFVVAAAIVAGIIGYSLNSDDGDRSSSPQSPIGSPPVPRTTSGGVDLVRYCQFYQYDTNSGEHCTSRIDLDNACDWQHGSPGHELRFANPDDPLSGVCYDPRDVSVGGIQDMPGYCKDRFDSVNASAALADEQTWVCQTQIDMNHVCSWQYGAPGIEARQDDGIWYCIQ